ncbi:MAG: hypothetical protein MJY96_09785 [Bacteroidaceae bacterium]|nr:hypothetical protein [Bacteroidaceae bacterium]
MSDEEKTLLLLQIIRVDGNINQLISFGLSFVDILNSLEDLKKKGIVVQKDNGLILTALGKSMFYSLNRKFGHRGLYKYLMPDYFSRITQLQTDDIYLPQKETVKEIVNEY